MYVGVSPVPDRAFVKELKTFDKYLRVMFHRGMERFVITKQRAFGGDFVVLVVNDERGGFRQPDQRDIRELFYGDLWRHGGVKERVRKGEERALAQEQREFDNAQEEFRAAAREDRIQTSNVMRKAFNEGSKAPEFRRVDLNRKGLTVEEIKAAKAVGRDPWAKMAA